MHGQHKGKFQEEFDKYARAALLNRSKPMQDALGSTGHKKRCVQDLFQLMLDHDDAFAKPPSPMRKRLKHHA